MKNKLIYIIAAVVVLAAVGGSLLLNKNKAAKNGLSTPTSSTKTTNPSSADSNNTSGEKVKVSGAVNKSFAPVKARAGTSGSGFIIYLIEPFNHQKDTRMPDTIDIISNSVIKQPGDYSLDDHTKPDALNQNLWIIYQVSNDFDGRYNSSKGTLTLTEAGEKYSGSFKFTAVNHKDSSKTIEVTGSFKGLKLN